MLVAGYRAAVLALFAVLANCMERGAVGKFADSAWACAARR